MKNKQQGFSHFIIVVAVALVTLMLIIFVGWRIYKNRASATNSQTSTPKDGYSESITAKTLEMAHGTPPTNKNGANTPKSNSGSSSPSSSSQASSTKPTVSILTPSVGENVTGGPSSFYHFACDYHAPSGIQKIVILLTHPQGNTDETTLENKPGEDCDVGLDTGGWSSGTYTVAFTVYDKAGVTASASRTFNFSH